MGSNEEGVRLNSKIHFSGELKKLTTSESFFLSAIEKKKTLPFLKLRNFLT